MGIKNIVSSYKENKLLKQGITFTLFATINNGLNFLLIFILSIYLTKQEFGVLNLFNIVILVFSVLISLGTQSYFSVVFFKKTKNYVRKILNAILIVSGITFVFFGVLILFESQSFADFIGFSKLYQFYALVICFVQLFYTINLEVYRLEEASIKYGLMTLLWAFLNFSITIYFCVSLKYGWTGRVDAQILASLILFFGNLIILIKKDYIKLELPRRSHFVKVLKFGLPLIPHNSTVWIRQGFDRFLINYFLGAITVGVFSFAYTFSGIIMMIGTAFNSTNSVYIFKTLQKNDIENGRKVLSKQIYLMTIIFLLITVIGLITGVLLIKFAIPKYVDAIPYMLPLSLAAFFQCVYYLFVNYLFFFNKTKRLMYITFSVSVFHFMISVLLTRYSALYTSYLSLLSNMIITILVIVYSNKIYPLFNLNKTQKISR